MITIAKQAWYWRMATIRCLVYMGITAGATFLTLTESYSTNQWLELGPFLKLRIYLSCLGAAGTVMVAFLDSTMGELRKTADESGKQITTVTTETSGPEVLPPAPSKTD